MIPAILAGLRAAAGWIGRAGAARVAVGATVREKHAVKLANANRVANFRDRLWAAESAANMAERLYAKIDGNLPSFQHSISVACRGGPEADLRRIWYLTLAAAFGRYRNRAAGVQSVEMEATWDVTGKACSVTIGYLNHGLLDAAVRVQNGAKQGISSGLGLIQQGPDQVTIGAGWPAFLYMGNQTIFGNSLVGGGAILSTVAGPVFGVVRGIIAILDAATEEGQANLKFAWTRSAYSCTRGNLSPEIVQMRGNGKGKPDVLREVPRNIGSLYFGKVLLPWRRVVPTDFGLNRQSNSAPYASILDTGKVPNLPDDGRLITTGEKEDKRVQNPRPPIDGLSRASLVQLVAQSLQSPCFTPTAVPCNNTTQLSGSSGLSFYPPGQGDEEIGYQSGLLKLAVNESSIQGTANPLGGAPANPVGPDGYPPMPASTVKVR